MPDPSHGCDRARIKRGFLCWFHPCYYKRNVYRSLACQQSAPRHEEAPGEIIFIPLGSLLVLPATTIHGGGMKAPLPPTTTDGVVDQSHGVIHQHPRFHFYVFPTRDEAEYSGANLFDMPSEMRLKLGTDHLEFSDLFVHSPDLQYTAENPGQLALGLLNDISPILIERTGGPG